MEHASLSQNHWPHFQSFPQLPQISRFTSKFQLKLMRRLNAVHYRIFRLKPHEKKLRHLKDSTMTDEGFPLVYSWNSQSFLPLGRRGGGGGGVTQCSRAYKQPPSVPNRVPNRSHSGHLWLLMWLHNTVMWRSTGQRDELCSVVHQQRRNG